MSTVGVSPEQALALGLVFGFVFCLTMLWALGKGRDDDDEPPTA
jgi:nitrogen fixation-related uncharacterized protein